MQTLLAGLLAVFSFAPFGMFPLSVVALLVLFRVWSRCENAFQAARAGFTFGMGLFSFGVGWVYVALHDYGYMHPLLAITATLLFAALASSPLALAGYVLLRIRTSERVRVLLLMPALWVMAEWLRGLMFTGFPWLVFGYSQVPGSPLLGYAPLFGVYGVSLAVAVSAGLLLFVSQARWSVAGKLALGGLSALWLLGAALQQVAWTQPSGEPLKVSLLQGNIPQDEKFSQETLVATLETYRRLAQGSDARLIVLPETAFPMLRHNVPPYYQQILRDHVQRNGGDILIGAFEKEGGSYFNSVYSLGTAESQHYRKDHLVPFGEFIPMRGVLGWFINEVLQIPMGDLSSGGDAQVPLAVAGQQVAVNICYEDVFGEEIIRQLPQATLLVNVTNDAWYGESNAAVQHNQMSQMRALETGRVMLRATNTGVTSIIGTDGQVLAHLPQHEEGVLTAVVQGYTGSTPYVRWGNVTVLILLALMLGAAARYSRL
ncbi:MAG: apolipoprotein N-acyltransferase [Pseudomonadota bacterium]